ncbi:TolB amino-terminal domain-containing protein [Bradyrhizobium erythrophlei]|uniref:TolB amino-terminal domain-containing protein n=1 Tax=Bradyrhizobium erythrophlei TaxID=1437360 RepID=A0A1M7URK2_9BRAD|nr:TolB amino-terminal domain-containing protein [Bradyrhizobium erythrophlei]
MILPRVFAGLTIRGAPKLLFSFNNCSVDTDRRELRHEGELRPVEPQVFDLLEFLIKNRDRMVSRDDLLAAVWNGRIVSESTLASRINAARTAIGDNGEDQRLIRTVLRKGIRFVGAVREEEKPVVATTGVATEQARFALPLPDRPSVAVLPFSNMSGDSEQDYFADGICEDIITGLSKLRWFFVIARNSTFIYKGRAVDIRQVGRELGVRYVLEGSVRKGGSRVRVTAQLIDGATGKHLWADHYDRDLTDIFALQDEITKKVVAAIEPKLLEAEGIRSQNRSPEDLDAWDMLIRANSLFWRLTKDESQAAIAILKQVVERHPFYAPAHGMLAFMLLVSRQGGWHLMEPQIAQATTLAARAVELDDSDPWGHLALGFVAFTRRQTDEAVEEFQRALDLNPNFAAAYGFLGCALAFDGRSDQAIDHIEQAIRMSPHDPQNALLNAALAAAHYQAGRYVEAVGFGRKAIQQRFELTNGHRIYVASLAQAGQIDDARSALARLQELHPENSIAWIERNVPYTPGPMAKFLEGFRKAGLR